MFVHMNICIYIWFCPYEHMYIHPAVGSCTGTSSIVTKFAGAQPVCGCPAQLSNSDELVESVVVLAWSERDPSSVQVVGGEHIQRALSLHACPCVVLACSDIHHIHM